MKEYKLDPTRSPHSIVDDAAGNIWYMGNGNGTIGKLVPATGEITVYQDARSGRARSAHRRSSTRTGRCSSRCSRAT